MLLTWPLSQFLCRTVHRLLFLLWLGVGWATGKAVKPPLSVLLRRADYVHEDSFRPPSRVDRRRTV